MKVDADHQKRPQEDRGTADAMDLTVCKCAMYPRELATMRPAIK